jgi:hypothetical protein
LTAICSIIVLQFSGSPASASSLAAASMTDIILSVAGMAALEFFVAIFPAFCSLHFEQLSNLAFEIRVL